MHHPDKIPAPIAGGGLGAEHPLAHARSYEISVNGLWSQIMVAALSLPRLRIRFHPHTRAHQVPIAVNVVDATDAGPELARARETIRECRRFARVRMIPRVGTDDPGGVRCVLQR